MTRIKKDIPGQWATPSLREVPFWREDMMPEEYDVERAYWAIFYGLDMCKPGYLPLWKQKELGLPEYEKNYKEAYQLNQKLLAL